MKWGETARQRDSSIHKLTRAHAHIYFRKLLSRCLTVSLLTFYSLFTHSPIPTQNSTIIKISPPSIPSGVFRGSPAGLPWVVRKETPYKKCTIIKIPLPNTLPVRRTTLVK